MNEQEDTLNDIYMTYVKRSLELRIEIHSFLHRVVIELMRQHDGSRLNDGSDQSSNPEKENMFCRERRHTVSNKPFCTSEIRLS